MKKATILAIILAVANLITGCQIEKLDTEVQTRISDLLAVSEENSPDRTGQVIISARIRGDEDCDTQIQRTTQAIAILQIPEIHLTATECDSEGDHKIIDIYMNARIFQMKEDWKKTNLPIGIIVSQELEDKLRHVSFAIDADALNRHFDKFDDEFSNATTITAIMKNDLDRDQDVSIVARGVFHDERPVFDQHWFSLSANKEISFALSNVAVAALTKLGYKDSSVTGTVTPFALYEPKPQ